MAHKHSIYDSDTHFVIDPVTREIKNESEKIDFMKSFEKIFNRKFNEVLGG